MTSATFSFAVPEVGSILIAPLVGCTELSNLIINGHCNLSTEDASLIPLVLHGSRECLQSVCLRQCTTVDPNTAEGIITKMAAMEFSSLTHLHLDALGIFGVATDSLVSVLTSCHHLRSLSLNENPGLGDANIAAGSFPCAVHHLSKSFLTGQD